MRRGSGPVADELPDVLPFGVFITTALRNASIAWFFFAAGCYTMLAPIDGPVPIGAAVLPRAGAIVLAASLVLAGLVAAASLRGVWRDDRLTDSRVAVTAWVAALALSALAGFDPARSLEMTGIAVLCALGHLAIVGRWEARGVAQALTWTVVAGGSALVVAALVMQITHRPHDVYAANLGRATGLFVTPNQFAAWLVPFVALATGLALTTRARLRVAAAAAALLGAIALGATFSIGGWIGGAAALVFGLWWLGRRRAAVATLAALIAIAGFAAFSPGITHHRLAERFVRLDAIGAGLRIVSAFPLLGVGPMTYPLVYAPFRTPSSTEDAVVSTHPHDVFVSLAAETGLVGVALAAFGWWRLGRAIRRALRTADDRSKRLAICICAGIAGRFVHGLVDLVAVVELTFFWLPYAALALAVARAGSRPLDRS